VTVQATHILTQADLDAGSYTNVATGTGDSPSGTDDVTTDSDAGTDENGDVITDPLTVDGNDVGTDPTDDPTVIDLTAIVETQFEIFNAISPDGDNLNDFFNIFGIEKYPNNNVKIYNRWGVLVFETDGYGGSDGQKNVFRGISEGRVTVQDSKELPTGTYYYILTIISDNPPNGKSNYSGYLYINR